MNPTGDSAVPRRSGRPRLAAWVGRVRQLARRRPRLTVAAVVVVTLVGVGAGVGVRVWSTGDPDGPGRSRSPRSAVQGYLDALADGRAADALAYLSRPPADRTFLTDAVLAQSRELAPMTGIAVGEVSEGYSSDSRCRHDCTVQVEYRLGDQTTKATVAVSLNHGYWFVDTEPRVVQLTGYRDYDTIDNYQVPVLVNGTPVAPGTGDVVLFPGRYHATSGHPLVDVDTTFTVEPATKNRADLVVQLQPALTPDGKGRVAQAAQDQLDSCLAQTAFDTGCGFVAHDSPSFDGPADPATIAWALTDDTAMPQPGDQVQHHGTSTVPWSRLTVSVPVEIQPRCTWTTVAGQAMEWEPHMPPNYYVADLTDPDRITVTFVWDLS